MTLLETIPSERFLQALDAGELWAICLYLGIMGQDRGWDVDAIDPALLKEAGL